MAITKIINIGGSSPADGARHLKAALKYIMNPKKTSDGIWVGGNCGNTVEECYSSMMQTKADWEKTDGRQHTISYYLSRPARVMRRQHLPSQRSSARNIWGMAMSTLFPFITISLICTLISSSIQSIA